MLHGEHGSIASDPMQRRNPMFWVDSRRPLPWHRAMEDNGCGFLANLSARNMSLGGCFSWSNIFHWEFKTLEVFCPTTCGCAAGTSAGSGCPRPFDMDCDLALGQCLTWKEQHWCPGINAEVVEAMILYDVADRSILHTAVDLRYFFVFNDISYFF